jgi:hypothetical protein
MNGVINDPIEIAGVVPLSEMRGDSNKDTALLRDLAGDAKAFLQGFDWCREVTDAYFGCGVGGVVGVFYFRIIPRDETIDRYLWVVVGDLPPAYLVTDNSRTPSEALAAYITEMRQWVAAVESGQSVDELIPVNAPATRDTALALKGRLEFLEKSQGKMPAL